MVSEALLTLRIKCNERRCGVMADKKMKPLEVIIPINGEEVIDILRRKLHFFSEPPVDIKQLELIHELSFEIRKLPILDVVEVKHGEWFLLDECANEGVYCSLCHKKVYRKDYANQKAKSNYCPNCGAKMDGGKAG